MSQHGAGIGHPATNLGETMRTGGESCEKGSQLRERFWDVSL
jgi:hypothetical protein